MATKTTIAFFRLNSFIAPVLSFLTVCCCALCHSVCLCFGIASAASSRRQWLGFYAAQCDKIIKPLMFKNCVVMCCVFCLLYFYKVIKHFLSFPTKTKNFLLFTTSFVFIWCRSSCSNRTHLHQPSWFCPVCSQQNDPHVQQIPT